MFYEIEIRNINYNNCTDIGAVSNSTEWRTHIANQIAELKNGIVSH